MINLLEQLRFVRRLTIIEFVELHHPFKVSKLDCMVNDV